MLEVIIAVAAAILLGNILAHRMRVPPAVLLIFLGLMLALIPAHQLNEVREVGLPPHVILEIFLPVMLFWETRNTSWREARARLRG
ncbi:MAG: sodium:proton antiporter, partial [Tannerella sp.]